jgi:hypothetical protein
MGHGIESREVILAGSGLDRASYYGHGFFGLDKILKKLRLISARAFLN